MENKVEELKLMEACKYLDVEDNHNVEHKSEKEMLECVRRVKLISNTDPSTKNKLQLDHWQHQY